MNLFDSLEENNRQAPLAEILRPKTLEEFLGQEGVVGVGSPIYNLLMSKRLFSFIFYGPPGCGKTTFARLVAKFHNADFIELSAVTSGVKEVKEAVESARESLRSGRQTILFIDEIHRYSKTQQDALLPHIENGTFHLIGSTTENPSFQVNPALISRCRVVMMNGLSADAMGKILDNGFNYLTKTFPNDVIFEDSAKESIVMLSGGDARYALNVLEESYFAISRDKKITVDLVEQLTQKKTPKYSVDTHYDLASAFQKSLRGSNPDAAIYYMAKMLLSGEDPRFIARRLMVVAAEDVGCADFRAILVADAAYRAVQELGMPECRIALAEAVEFVARAKKSNRAIRAIDSAMADIKSGLDYLPPKHLRDAHYKDASKYGAGIGYIYTHDNPDVYQEFMPDELIGKKYFT